MAFLTPIRVRFYELDPYDHVNHSAYIQYFEAARVELLDAVGMGLVALRDQGFELVVTELHTRFLHPAGAGDELVVETEVVELRRASTRWRQRLRRDDRSIAEQEMVIAATSGGRPVRLPGALVEAVRPYLR